MPHKDHLAIAFIALLNAGAMAQRTTTAYQNYDFVPGEHILFTDDQGGDQDGEFPAHWKLLGGQAVVNHDTTRHYVAITQYYTVMAPRMKQERYLPADAWTLEFDYYLDAKYDGNPGVSVSLRDGEEVATIVPNRDHFYCSFPGGNLSGDTPLPLRGEVFYDRWHHIAIAFRKGQLKVYVDQFRTLTVPDLGATPTSIAIKGDASEGMNMFFGDLRLAEGGGMNMLGQLLTDGHFITHAITFDVDRSTIKPESMGFLNELAKWMKDNAAVKLEIDGHTDSDGDDAANMRLSAARAEAVAHVLTELGIPAARLSTKGFGESKPISDNSTPEGKAANRRVEFIRS